jgi:hypothetical protein
MFDVILRKRSNGCLIRSVCDDYKSLGWLHRFLSKSTDYQIVSIDKTNMDIVPWCILRDHIILSSRVINQGGMKL